MGSVSLPIGTMMYVAMGATVAAAGASAYESHEAGVATADADKRKARLEADNEKQKQINMRQNMLRALATQNAAAGTGNVGVSKAGALRQIDQAQNDIMVSNANASGQVSMLDQAAQNAELQGNIAAGVDIMKAASSAANG